MRPTHRADFPFLKTIDDFNFTYQTSPHRFAVGISPMRCRSTRIRPYGTGAANMLFLRVNDRHRRHRSMIFTTNKTLKAWGEVPR
jgi:hypothetical protein